MTMPMPIELVLAAHDFEMPCVMSITRTSGAIRAITPWQAATNPSKVP